MYNDQIYAQAIRNAAAFSPASRMLLKGQRRPYSPASRQSREHAWSERLHSLFARQRY